MEIITLKKFIFPIETNVMEKENTLCKMCEMNVNNDVKVLLCDGFGRSWYHAKSLDINRQKQLP